MWGGLKLPPNSATRIEQSSLFVEQERAAVLAELPLVGRERSAHLVERRARVDALAHCGAAGEQIDRGRVTDELVGFGPPREVAGGELVGRVQQRHAGAIGAKARAAGDVQLHAAARLTRE